jgi:hypothetical protein
MSYRLCEVRPRATVNGAVGKYDIERKRRRDDVRCFAGLWTPGTGRSHHPRRLCLPSQGAEGCWLVASRMSYVWFFSSYLRGS